MLSLAYKHFLLHYCGVASDELRSSHISLFANTVTMPVYNFSQRKVYLYFFAYTLRIFRTVKKFLIRRSGLEEILK